MPPQYEWNEDKARTNLRKHQIRFQEGATVFNDPLVATLLDPDHSFDEQRYIAIGRSVRGRVLVVIFTEREAKIRLISCRKATLQERKAYEEDNF
jgi:uncharacterized DUF497 family protein